ncbi:MAG: hypothetical protein FWE24_03410 [Defluviitaleaceae bacterium]|nr:hypothetical protein [Defluviitaleaceae bacterium]
MEILNRLLKIGDWRVLFMEWSKAKDIVIVFLVLLNIMLGVILLIGSGRYTLSAEQERNIVEILETNNISINTQIIRRFNPMRMLELSPGVIDDYKMKEVFFGTTDNIITDEWGNIRTHDHGNDRLIVFQNMVIFESGNFNEFREIDFASARQISDDFLASLGDMARGFTLDIDPYFNGNEIIIEYRQQFEGTIIYNNYFLFAIDNYGIRRVEHSHNMPIGFSASANELFSTDEVLFSFLQAMRVESLDRPRRIIEKMDIVYFMDPDDLELGIAYPYFRIYYREYTSDGTYVTRLRMVNAYLNTWRRL